MEEGWCFGVDVLGLKEVVVGVDDVSFTQIIFSIHQVI